MRRADGFLPRGSVRPDTLDRPLTAIEQDAAEAFKAFAADHVCRPQGFWSRLLGRPAPTRECFLQIRAVTAAPTGYSAVARCACGAERDVTDPRV